MNEPTLIPQEYVNERKEIRRTSFGVVLFVIVMAGVVAAFLVTNRQWDSVRIRQQEVAAEFSEVGEKISRMDELRIARDDLVERAELASALVSRVPRSMLLDGLVERMPMKLSWTKLTMASKEAKKPVVRSDPKNDRLKPRGPAAAPVRTRGKKNAHSDLPEERPVPKKYTTTITLTGLATDEVDVSTYVASLQSFSLLSSVMPDSTEIITVDDVEMRKFTITMELDQDAIYEGFSSDSDDDTAISTSIATAEYPGEDS
ncbi:MAG: hypothetical protein CBC35_07760 [Planctomycetes bacterium TMED75]|nr:hypothetical protein [Planctomycetaceae bacterium]OUU92251.1 MAG: hypothetical protein CBC35_07760 [Planctomycetes bacterium TMED75]